MGLARWLALSVVLAAAGCASVAIQDGERLRLTSPEFRDYVEQVFREQNRVADTVAFALEEPNGAAALAAAEQRLLAACAGVNELATARRDQRRLGVRRSLRAARSVPECERVAQEVEALLAP